MPAKAKTKKKAPKGKAPRFKHFKGRPTIFSDDVVNTICDLLAAGNPLNSICEAADMPSTTTVFRWLADEGHKSFRELYARAREAQAQFLAEEMLAIADDRSEDWVTDENGVKSLDHEHVKRSQLRIDVRKWHAARLAPKVYGDRILQEHTGADGGPLEVHTFNIPDNGR